MARSFSGWSVARLRQYIRDTIRNKIYFKEQTTAPDVRSGVEEAVIYAKDDSGTTKLYYKDSAGAEYTLGGGGADGISWDGSTANGVATFKDADEATVESNLTFDGSTLTVTGDASVTGDTTLGNASGDTATINAKTIVLYKNWQPVTDNTVLVYNGSSIVTDEIDSKVWAGGLVDYTGTPANNQIAVWTDTDTLEGDSNFTWDGSAASRSTGILGTSRTPRTMVPTNMNNAEVTQLSV